MDNNNLKVFYGKIWGENGVQTRIQTSEMKCNVSSLQYFCKSFVVKRQIECAMNRMHVKNAMESTDRNGYKYLGYLFCVFSVQNHPLLVILGTIKVIF